MTKTRILGITLFVIGIIIMFKIENGLSPFIGGFFVGVGVVLVIYGKTIFSKKLKQ